MGVWACHSSFFRVLGNRCTRSESDKFASAPSFCPQLSPHGLTPLAKPLALFGFEVGPDDADCADDCAAPAWVVVVVVMWIVRFRLWPLRSKVISMPILRRKVAARRTRPD